MRKWGIFVPAFVVGFVVVVVVVGMTKIEVKALYNVKKSG